MGTKNYTKMGLAVSLIIILVVIFMSSMASAQGTVLSIEETELVEGETAELFITLNKAINGLTRLDGSLTTGNQEVLQLKSITPEAISEQYLQIVSENEQEIKFKLVDLGKKVDPGDKNVHLLKLEVEGRKSGKAELSVTDVMYTDEDGKVIEPTVTPANITVRPSGKEENEAKPESQEENGPEEDKPKEEETKKEETREEKPTEEKTEGPDEATVTSAEGKYVPEIPEIGIKLGETKPLYIDISSIPGGLRVARVVVINSGGLTFANLRVLNPAYFEILEQSKELLTFRVGDFDREIPPDTGRLNLAEIGINAEKVGRTKVEVKLTLWTDEGELVKTAGSAPVNVGVGPIGNTSAPPADPNGDGMYEDIDGDGEVTETDAFLLAFNLDSPALQNNPELFDFNRDGKITFDDAIELIRLVE